MKTYIFEIMRDNTFEYYYIDSANSLDKTLTELPQAFFENVNRVWTNAVLTVDKKRDNRPITAKQLSILKPKAKPINEYNND
jgi:hypothetical protein